MPEQLRFPRIQTFDNAYWLCRCQGFRVESPDGDVGAVSELRYLSRLDRPDALLVRSGLAGRRLTLVSIEQVAVIAPGEKRIMLRCRLRDTNHRALAGRLFRSLNRGRLGAPAKPLGRSSQPVDDLAAQVR